MNRQVLITGGAGFIGSYVADELLRAGYRVRALDALVPQVHENQRRPAYLTPEVELIVGDVRNRDAVRRSLRGVSAVLHFAALVGVGQSMYQIENYTAANNLGTAVLLEELTSQPVERLVVASSMSVYGEGLYATPGGSMVSNAERTNEQLRARQWELRSRDGEVLTALPTPETKPPALASVYALSKFVQEQMALMIGRAYNMPTVALRFFNVYGPRQALSNPYTGVLAIFASRLLNNRRPLVFEDGLQQRDFVNVKDVAVACRQALEAPAAVGGVFNIGSGHAYTVRDIARELAQVQNRPDLTPVITHTYRRGDIRHCFADITLARMALGYQPQVTLEAGLRELSGWLDTQVAVDRVAEAGVELGVDGMKPAPNGHSERPVLITGGAGFIGTNIADRLLRQGRRVLVFDNVSRTGVDRNWQWLRATHAGQFDLVVGDVRDADAVRNAVSRASAVFHCAAQVAVTTSLVRPVEDFEINARGTLNLLEAIRAQAAPIPLVYTTTNKVCGVLDDVALESDGRRYAPAPAALRHHGFSEARPVDYHSPYGCSKGAAGQYVADYARSFGLPTVAFRMSCIYGPHQFGTEDQGWVAHFVIRALEGRPIVIYGDGKQVRDLLFVDDLVSALLLGQQHAAKLAGRTFNIGGGPSRAVSVLEVIDLIGEVTGRRPRVRFDKWHVGDQRYCVSDTREFQRATGWAARVGVREGLRQLVAWLRPAKRSAVAPVFSVTALGRRQVAKLIRGGNG